MYRSQEVHHQELQELKAIWIKKEDKTEGREKKTRKTRVTGQELNDEFAD